MVSDPLVLAKLEVFIYKAKLVLLFLKKYQTDKSMMPFITEDLCDILQSLMARLIKSSILTGVTTSYKLTDADVNDKSTWLPPDEV